MTRKKTHQEYVQQLFDLEIDYNPLEEYKGGNVAILHECINGHQWKTFPSSILKGVGCRTCKNEKQVKTNEQYVKELKLKGIDSFPVDKYSGSRVPILHECVNGHRWNISPDNLLRGKKCVECVNSNRKGIYSEKYFEKHPEEGDKPGVLYCVVLVDKKTMERKCIKIGITQGTSYKDVSKRAVGFTGYETRVQKIVKGRLEESYYLEQYLHELWQERKYKSEWKFGGHSELFELDDAIIRSIPDHV